MMGYYREIEREKKENQHIICGWTGVTRPAYVQRYCQHMMQICKDSSHLSAHIPLQNFTRNRSVVVLVLNTVDVLVPLRPLAGDNHGVTRLSS